MRGKKEGLGLCSQMFCEQNTENNPALPFDMENKEGENQSEGGGKKNLC